MLLDYWNERTYVRTYVREDVVRTDGRSGSEEVKLLNESSKENYQRREVKQKKETDTASYDTMKKILQNWTYDTATVF